MQASERMEDRGDGATASGRGGGRSASPACRRWERRNAGGCPSFTWVGCAALILLFAGNAWVRGARPAPQEKAKETRREKEKEKEKDKDKEKTKGAKAVAFEAELPIRQKGSRGEDAKRAASGGRVLGSDFGGRTGDFAEYDFELDEELEPARIAVRYARALPGHGDLEVSIDGEARGLIRYRTTSGWGDAPGDLVWESLDLGRLEAGKHRLRLTVLRPRLDREFPEIPLAPSPVLDLAGGRDDKNSVGQGSNVALYTGQPSRFYWSTFELGDVFSAVDGGTLRWYPDQVIVSPESGGGESTNVNLDQIVISLSPVAEGGAPVESPLRSPVIEERQIGITRDDVVVARIHLHNPGSTDVEHAIEITGDITGSRDWRGSPGGEKFSQKRGDFAVLIDKNVFPGLIDGLAFAVGGREPPTELTTRSAGTYEMVYRVKVARGGTETLVVACAIDPDVEEAQQKLVATLADPDPLATIRKDWARFYREDVPRFSSSDPKLDELWAFRWFLLRFSTVGGGLGFFEKPVVLEGRSAYRTLCCYSAPFHAFDLAWANDPSWGSGHLESLARAEQSDGRLPWYTSPTTNRVPIHHRSGTGLSLLPYAAWRQYLIHTRREDVKELWPALARNVDWWVRDRDPDGDGLFTIDHQLETGMDDLLRWPDPRLPYRSVDASSYAALNARATAKLATALGLEDEAARYGAIAGRTAEAIRKRLWDPETSAFRDLHPESAELARSVVVTTFYPYFAGVGGERELDLFRRWLLSPLHFSTPYPVPALPRSDPDFDPQSFWQGPSWPAATSHVVDALAGAAKSIDRSLLPNAAELLRRALGKHLAPRPDFYERYNPETGDPLSSFRDYMHSWWIDTIIRHIVGLEPHGDAPWVIDPLPFGLDHYVLLGAPYRGRTIDVAFESRERREGAEFPRGLTVRVDGVVVVSDPEFVPGAKVVIIPDR